MAVQQTLRNRINLEGVGLHTGKSVRMTLNPAPEGTGIVFRRVDVTPPVDLAIKPDHIQEALLCTKLVGERGAEVSTIEHLMSAFAGMQIDNVIVELNAPEVPVMDGSSEPLLFAIRAAGIAKQKEVRKFLRIKKTIRVEDGDKFTELSPYGGELRLHLTIDFPHPVIARTAQSIEFDLTPTSYFAEVSRARTFGMAKDIEKLHAKGLALGASLDNAVGIGDNDVLNREGLRYADEFIRHKLLDTIGDLYVAGPIRGFFRGHKVGHALNNKLLRAVFADVEAWDWVE